MSICGVAGRPVTRLALLLALVLSASTPRPVQEPGMTRLTALALANAILANLALALVLRLFDLPWSALRALGLL